MIGMITINVNAIQMLLWRAVQVVFAAALQPACVWLEIKACTTMMPIIIITSMVIKTPIIPELAPFANVFPS